MDCCKWKRFFVRPGPGWHEFACVMPQMHYLLAAPWEFCIHNPMFARFLSRAKEMLKARAIFHVYYAIVRNKSDLYLHRRFAYVNTTLCVKHKGVDGTLSVFVFILD